MDTSEALKITEAIALLAKTFDEPIQEFTTSICLFYDERRTIINEAIKLHEEFRNADIVKRGALLGLDIAENDNGYETSIILSNSQTNG